jgi:hypothetical protein
MSGITTIIEDWMLIPEDLTFVMNKDRGNRLIFALMLLFYRLHGRLGYDGMLEVGIENR